MTNERRDNIIVTCVVLKGANITHTLFEMDLGAKVIMSIGRDDEFSSAALARIGVQAFLTKSSSRETLSRILHEVPRKPSEARP